MPIMELNIYHLEEKVEPSDIDFSDEKQIFIIRRQSESQQNFDTFLDKMMASAKISLTDQCKIININNEEKVNLSSIIHDDKGKKFLIFGVKPTDISFDLNMPLYHCITLLKHQFIFAENLSTLLPNKEKKGKLWAEMKYMFKIQ